MGEAARGRSRLRETSRDNCGRDIGVARIL